MSKKPKNILVFNCQILPTESAEQPYRAEKWLEDQSGSIRRALCLGAKRHHIIVCGVHKFMRATDAQLELVLDEIATYLEFHGLDWHRTDRYIINPPAEDGVMDAAQRLERKQQYDMLIAAIDRLAGEGAPVDVLMTQLNPSGERRVVGVHKRSLGQIWEVPTKPVKLKFDQELEDSAPDDISSISKENLPALGELGERLIDDEEGQ